MSFFKNIIFKNGSVSKCINIKSNRAVNINISDNSINVDNINLCSLGDNLQKSYVKLSGDFNNSNINVKTSITLEADNNFKCNNLIKLCAKATDTIVIMGDFTKSKGIKLGNPSIIYGSNANPIKGLSLNISPINFKGVTNIRGDFSKAKITVNKPSKIKCYGKINKLIAKKEAIGINLELEGRTFVEKLVALCKVNLEGEEVALNKTISNAYGDNNVVISGIYKYVKFEKGRGSVVTKIKKPGKYNLILEVKQGSKNSIIDKKIDVDIRKLANKRQSN